MADGHLHYCKDCVRAKARGYYRADPEPYFRRSREQRQRNGQGRGREHLKGRGARVPVEQQRARIRAYMREWHRRKNAEQPLRRLEHSLRSRLTKVVRAAGSGERPGGRLLRLLGCDGPALAAHLESQFQPGMSWANYGEWHVDHKLPLSSFNLSDPTQMAAAWHHSNLQPLWRRDNLRKGPRIAACLFARANS